MSGGNRFAPVPASLAALVVLGALLAPCAAGIARAGDGTAMFGLTPASSSGDSGQAARAAGNACQAKPATPSAATPVPPPPRAVDDDEDDDGMFGTFEGFDELSEKLAETAILLGQLQFQATPVAPVAPVAPAAPRAAKTPRPAARPAPVVSAREKARADRALRRARSSTDTTVVVKPGSRFELHNFGGEVKIATWARNAVRVEAQHSRRDWAEVSQANGLLRVVSVSPKGPAQQFEYRLTVPTWMPVSLSGVYNDVSATGLQGGLAVETVRGDIVVKQAAGAIELRSVEGLVDLSEAKGTIKVSSVNDGVRLLRVAGVIEAEAVNGDIQLLDLSSKSVEATTVNGAVLFDGKMLDDGSYRFSTHNGDIALALTSRSNATVTVSTYAGEFEAPFPIRLSRSEPGKRFAFALGNGKARVDVESFQGAIQLFKPGDPEVMERFRESWREIERERIQSSKWIWKGWDVEDAHDDQDDEDEVDTQPVNHKKHK